MKFLTAAFSRHRDHPVHRTVHLSVLCLWLRDPRISSSRRRRLHPQWSKRTQGCPPVPRTMRPDTRALSRQDFPWCPVPCSAMV